eukprot:COSAG01_NODE_1067_length_11878_cov_89.529077_2_plen_187_part_00
MNVTEVYVLCKVGELLTAEVVCNEAGLRAGVARGGEVLVRAGATIELGVRLEIAADCAIVGEPGGAAPPMLRWMGGNGDLIVSKQGEALELRGLRLERGGGEFFTAVGAIGGQLAVRDCEVSAGGTGVYVADGCQAELHGVTIHGCKVGVAAWDNATVCTLRGCTLRENGTDCKEERGGKIVREEG